MFCHHMESYAITGSRALGHVIRLKNISCDCTMQTEMCERISGTVAEVWDQMRRARASAGAGEGA